MIAEKIADRWIDIFIRTFNRAADGLPDPRSRPTSRQAGVDSEDATRATEENNQRDKEYRRVLTVGRPERPPL